MQAWCSTVPVLFYCSGNLLANQPSNTSVLWWKAVLGRGPEDACDASAQQSLEELGCWSDNNFLVFGWKFLGQPNITLGWTRPPPLSPVCSLSLSPCSRSDILMPKIHNNGRKEKVFIPDTSHAFCVHLCIHVSTSAHFYCAPAITAASPEWQYKCKSAF